MANTPIRELDFDQIKRSLKDYLRGQEQFKDYDFEGSTMNILLDLLAYNTHYQAFYANMVANEAFLDSAVVRNSVVSLAKHLDYRPRSKKAARILVNVELVPITSRRVEPAGVSVTAGKEYVISGSTFTSRDALGKTVSFVSLDDYRFRVVGGRFLATDVTLYEGTLKTASFIVNTKDSLQRFLIDDSNIDIDTLVVKVQRSVNDNEGFDEIWTRVNDINKLDGNSRVFFVQEAEAGKWEIYFGDGIVGQAVLNGNLIRMVYLATNGDRGNGIGATDSQNFKAFTSNNPEHVVTVVTDEDGDPQPSYGGSEPETVESIKFYAPRNYQAQNRAVTSDDYLAILAKEYSLRSESFLVWGGEENDPPQYGKVFISIKPRNSSKLSVTEKQAISRTILGERNLVTVTPEIVDPDVTYINPTIQVFYNPQATTATPDILVSGITQKVLEFGDKNLDQFGKNFRQSKFSAYIDSLDSAINSSTVSVVLEKRIEPKFGVALPYTVKFDNALFHPIDGYPPIIDSSAFYHKDLTSEAINKPTVVAYLDDDGYGNVRIYKKIGQERVYLNRKAGTVNYTTGLVEVKPFSPIGIPDGSVEIKIKVRPNKSDVLVRRNQVLVMNESEIDVVVSKERTVIDRSASDAGFPYPYRSN